jgi:hypothetical protein
MDDEVRRITDPTFIVHLRDAAEVEELARWLGSRPDDLAQILSASPTNRRWLRSRLLPTLPEPERAALAERLLGWTEDFDPFHRDPSTAAVVQALPEDALDRGLCWLAGTNAATALWERLARHSPDLLHAAARRVLQDGSSFSRETMLYLLFIDPGYANAVSEAKRIDILAAALLDPDEHVRGLAAEIATALAPGLLLARLDAFLKDESEHVRSAAWTTMSSVDPEAAAERGIALITDEQAPLAIRRSALAAVGRLLSTQEIAPLLAWLVRHPEPTLAGDAADLLWRYHRHPLAARAAAASDHPDVRAVAERLLHPERGSPAAGGVRPGSPASQSGRYGLPARPSCTDPRGTAVVDRDARSTSCGSGG